MEQKLLSLSEVADMLSISKETLRRWDATGKLVSVRHPINGYRMYKKSDLKKFNENMTAEKFLKRMKYEYSTKKVREYIVIIMIKII